MENENKKYLLPFHGIKDLEQTFKKLLTASIYDTDRNVMKLREAGVPHERLGDHGVSVDVSKIPTGVEIKDLFIPEEKTEFYRVSKELGAIINENAVPFKTFMTL